MNKSFSVPLGSKAYRDNWDACFGKAEERNDVSTVDRAEERECLEAVADQLGDVELTVLTRIAQRLLAGQKAYGKWTAGKRKNQYEAFEEACDLAVYTACAMHEITATVDGKGGDL
jgi:hypothetical protein